MAKHQDDWVSRQDIIRETGLKKATVDHAIKAFKTAGIIVARPGLSVISVQKVPLRKSNEISNLTITSHDYTIDSKGISAF